MTEPLTQQPEREESEEQLIYYRPSFERLRIILMFFMCLSLLGLPTLFGELIRIISGFSSLAFFILSGYLVLRESEDRSQQILRAIKRSAIVFGALAVVYFVLNLLYYRSLGINIFVAFTSKRMWFNFAVLNIWPFDIGGAIWYVQALLYAYIIIYFLDKWDLLRFDWIIAAVLIALAVVSGELAGVVKWNVFGYSYLPGNFFTRALPYILLGGFIHRKGPFLTDIIRPIYLLGIVIGTVLSVAEILGLGALGVPGHYTHLIGMGLIAFSVCMLAFQDRFPEPGFEQFLNGNRWYANTIYYVCQPLSIGIVWLISILNRPLLPFVSSWIGIITFALCMLLLCGVAFLSRILSQRRKNAAKAAAVKAAVEAAIAAEEAEEAIEEETE